jgi:hypothetical protein
MVERRIYSSFAFSENEQEKMHINHEIYTEELKPKSKQFYGNSEPTEQERKDFTCYKCIKNGYGHNVYRIFSNPHNLSTLQLALICDGGNLCFGYRMEGSNTVIHTD